MTMLEDYHAEQHVGVPAAAGGAAAEALADQKPAEQNKGILSRLVGTLMSLAIKSTNEPAAPAPAAPTDTPTGDDADSIVTMVATDEEDEHDAPPAPDAAAAAPEAGDQLVSIMREDEDAGDPAAGPLTSALVPHYQHLMGPCSRHGFSTPSMAPGNRESDVEAGVAPPPTGAPATAPDEVAPVDNTPSSGSPDHASASQSSSTTSTTATAAATTDGHDTELDDLPVASVQHAPEPMPARAREPSVEAVVPVDDSTAPADTVDSEAADLNSADEHPPVRQVTPKPDEAPEPSTAVDEPVKAADTASAPVTEAPAPAEPVAPTVAPAAVVVPPALPTVDAAAASDAAPGPAPAQEPAVPTSHTPIHHTPASMAAASAAAMPPVSKSEAVSPSATGGASITGATPAPAPTAAPKLQTRLTNASKLLGTEKGSVFKELSAKIQVLLANASNTHAEMADIKNQLLQMNNSVAGDVELLKIQVSALERLLSAQADRLQSVETTQQMLALDMLRLMSNMANDLGALQSFMEQYEHLHSSNDSTQLWLQCLEWLAGLAGACFVWIWLQHWAPAAPPVSPMSSVPAFEHTLSQPTPTEPDYPQSPVLSPGAWPASPASLASSDFRHGVPPPEWIYESEPASPAASLKAGSAAREPGWRLGSDPTPLRASKRVKSTSDLTIIENDDLTDLPSRPRAVTLATQHSAHELGRYPRSMSEAASSNHKTNISPKRKRSGKKGGQQHQANGHHNSS